MKTREWLLLATLGLLTCPKAHGANNPYPMDAGYWLQEHIPYRLQQVKDLPLYELGASPIAAKPADPYVKNVLGVARHVFFERTTHSMTLGARVNW